MDVELILSTSFIALIGLQLCVPENPNGKFEKQIQEQLWTRNPFLRRFYGLSNILGVIFVLGTVGFLTFTEHWWYVLVYIGGLIGAMIIAFILRFALMPFYRMCHDIPTFAEIKVQRIVGCALILLGVILFILAQY